MFTSHFYSTLEKKGGVEKVSTWTLRRKIDIFEKKFIIIPGSLLKNILTCTYIPSFVSVNKHLHWSLCVVVNPSWIINHEKFVENHAAMTADESEMPMPCIVFLDSLKAHGKSRVGMNIRKWLNAEWSRAGRQGSEAAIGDSEPTSKDVFTAKNMRILSPIGK